MEEENADGWTLLGPELHPTDGWGKKDDQVLPPSTGTELAT